MKLTVNEQGLLAKLNTLFSNNTKIWTELLQNACRAGATEVNITTEQEGEHESLTFKDNGEGIKDFSKLFNVAQSGWDDSTINTQSAFGMGFTSTLFVCRQLLIRSNGRYLLVDTEDIINQQEFFDVPDDGASQTGTSITLIGLNDNVKKSLFSKRSSRPLQVLHEASEGYALNVYINDEKANSRYSIPALRQCSNFIERRTSCATVFIDHKAVNLQPKTFLQGAAISSSLTSVIYTYGSHLPTVIVHFDDSVPARMPDRDCLIDDSDVVSEIRALFNQTMVEMVDSDLSTMSEEAFLADERCHSRLKNYCPERLNKMSCLPMHTVVRSGNYDFDRRDNFDETIYEGVLTKSDIKDLTLVAMPECDCEYDDEDMLTLHALMACDDVVFVQTGLYPTEHWIHSMTMDFDSFSVTLDASKAGEPIYFTSDYYLFFDIVLCESLAGQFTTGKRAPLDWTVSDNVLYISNDCDIGTKADLITAALNSYQSEFSYLETEFEADSHKLQEFVTLHRVNSDSELLESILERALAEHGHATKAKLATSAFTITFDDQGNFTLK
ncbi:ATP-binding protein [Vibrio chaetopteri]|uniref:ATP-binding protein n=1 Tax=Vibrio chaetopteri TaxID=3016528 RepID=A0AAU8BS61_9VIBR